MLALSVRHLSRLHLKTIISLTIEKPLEDLEKFIASIGARSMHCPISRTIALNDPALLPALIPCLNVGTPKASLNSRWMLFAFFPSI